MARYSIDTKIIGPTPPGALELAEAYVRSQPFGPNRRLAETLAYVRELHGWCVRVGVDFVVAFGQWCDETGVGTSFYWYTYLNPAGLGALETRDKPGQITYVGGTFDPPKAARAHVIHLWLYAVGTTLPAELAPYEGDDPRWDAARPNAGKGPTLRALAGAWAANLAYASQIVSHIDRAMPGMEDPDVAMTGYNFDPALVPFPAMDMMIVAKPGERAGFDRVPSRKNRIVGVCDHITAGNGTIPGYRAFFGTGGERAWDALVDAIIAPNGDAAWYNYPYDDNLGGTRSPWASGGTDGLEGDGPAFIRALGIEAINGRLVSKEHIRTVGQPIPDAMIDTSGRITAAVMQRAREPWDSYPVNPSAGCVTHMIHSEFTGKGGDGPEECPGLQFKLEIDPIQDFVRGLLKVAQQTGVNVPTTTAAPPAPVPPTKPVENPAHDLYPDGMPDYAAARKAFGTGTKHRRDGTDVGFGFQEKNPVSLAWLARGATEMSWPKIDEWWENVNSNGTVRHMVTFKKAGWTLINNADRRGWQWL
jgi:hypothetical protein